MNFIKILFLFLLTCTLSFVEAQTVRIVDNNSNAPTGNLIYSTLQDAADAAVAGDIIYIQPSPTTYGDMTITKELHIKGIGFNLDKDLPHLSTMGILNFWNNTDNTSNSSNSTVTGVYMNYARMGHGSGGAYTLDNIKIYNCILTNVSYAISNDAYANGTEVNMSNIEIYDNDIRGALYLEFEVTDLLIRNNLLRGHIFLLSTSSSQTAIITNNIIYGRIQKGSEGDAVIIQHNNFLGANGSNYAFVTKMMDATIANNIFYGRTPSLGAGGGSTSTSFQRNVFSNNLTYETGNDEMPPSGGGAGNTGDQNKPGESPLFLNASVVNTWSSARDFTLSSSPVSPAANAASDGSDIGISGGPYPFNGGNFASKTSPLPTIQILNTDAIINPTDNLDIRINIKAN